MRQMGIAKELSLLLACIATGGASPAWGALFTDTTFDVADYSAYVYQTGGAVINFSQTLTGGNPGSALQVTTEVPATGVERFNSEEYFVNRQLSYSPETQGILSSIDFSLDRYFQVTDGFPIVSIFATILIVQDGNFYAHSVSLPVATGIFQTGAASGLQASDLYLITDFATLTTDVSKHPNFAGGPIQFGFATGWFSSPHTRAITVDVRSDNFSISLRAVPEAETYFLMLGGLVVVTLLRLSQFVTSND